MRKSGRIRSAIAVAVVLGVPCSGCRSDAHERASASNQASPSSPQPDPSAATPAAPAHSTAGSSTPTETPDDPELGRLELPPDGQAVIPLESRVYPITKASMDSGQQATFVVDTGTSLTVLQPDRARIWDLEAKDFEGLEVKGLGRSVTARRVTEIPALQFHQVRMTDVVAMLIPVPMAVDGILGIASIAQAPLLVDGAKLEARFIKSDRLADALKLLYPGRHWTKLGVEFGEFGARVALKAGERAIKMRLDTGSNCTELFAQAVKNLDLPIIEKRPFAGFDVAGELHGVADVFEVRDLQFGKWSIRVEFQSPTAVDPDFGDGNLGYDVLGRIPTVFDFQRGDLWICDPPTGDSGSLQLKLIDQLRFASRDPMPLIRLLVVSSIATSFDAQRIAVAADLLDDPVDEIREEAARCLKEFTKEPWTDESFLDDARRWWAAHKDDERFR